MVFGHEEIIGKMNAHNLSQMQLCDQFEGAFDVVLLNLVECLSRFIKVNMNPQHIGGHVELKQSISLGE